MATYTSNYAWTKPEGGDPVDITVLNNNLDSQDNIVHNAYMQLAPVFSTASTYAVGDVVLYANSLYKCITAVTVAGDWDAAKWTQVKVSDICGGGGGTSDYSQLTNKPSINSVTLSGNKTSADLGLQDAIQVDTMPTASATYDGKIVQFIGTTTASYTHGYYYECVENNGVYSWVQTNVQPSGGGGTSDYPNLTNKPQINGVTLVGNKPSSDFGLINTFQGTIAEWNQLTTAEKKAYDHASIPDSLDGNVTFPASKVMMQNGKSVEETIGGYDVIHEVTGNGVKTYSQLLDELYPYADSGLTLNLSGMDFSGQSAYDFYTMALNAAGDNITPRFITLKASGSVYKTSTLSWTLTDRGSGAVTSGVKIQLRRYH